MNILEISILIVLAIAGLSASMINFFHNFDVAYGRHLRNEPIGWLWTLYGIISVIGICFTIILYYDILIPFFRLIM